MNVFRFIIATALLLGASWLIALALLKWAESNSKPEPVKNWTTLEPINEY